MSAARSIKVTVFREILSTYGMIQQEIARKSGLNIKTLSLHHSGTQLMSRRSAIKVARAIPEGELKQKWLDLYGVGESILEDIDEDDGEFCYVPRYSVKAAMGPGFDVDSEQIINYLAFQKDWISSMRLDPDKLALIEAEGDSMKDTFPSGALVLLDLRVPLRGDGHYAIHSEMSGVMLKRLRFRDDSIDIISDNRDIPESERKSTVRADSLRILGRAVWFGRRV